MKDRDSIYQKRQVSAIAERWDAKAGDWDASLKTQDCHLNEDDAYPRFLREARTVIEQRCSFCTSHGVIDAGCGTGLVLAEVVPFFSWGIGVDLSPAMIRGAQHKQIPQARFVSGECFELSRICPPAGAIISRGVLLSHYGLEQGEKLLSAARAALVPGGFLLWDFLNADYRNEGGHEAKDKILLSAEAALGLACRAGFQNPQILGKSLQRVLILLLCA
jgi:SAM-dependent methyltransferase